MEPQVQEGILSLLQQNNLRIRSLQSLSTETIEDGLISLQRFLLRHSPPTLELIALEEQFNLHAELCKTISIQRCILAGQRVEIEQLKLDTEDFSDLLIELNTYC